MTLQNQIKDAADFWCKEIDNDRCALVDCANRLIAELDAAVKTDVIGLGFAFDLSCTLTSFQTHEGWFAVPSNAPCQAPSYGVHLGVFATPH